MIKASSKYCVPYKNNWCQAALEWRLSSRKCHGSPLGMHCRLLVKCLLNHGAIVYHIFQGHVSDPSPKASLDGVTISALCWLDSHRNHESLVNPALERKQSLACASRVALDAKFCRKELDGATEIVFDEKEFNIAKQIEVNTTSPIS